MSMQQARRRWRILFTACSDDVCTPLRGVRVSWRYNMLTVLLCMVWALDRESPDASMTQILLLQPCNTFYSAPEAPIRQLARL